MKREGWRIVADWVAVFLIVFISVALATFLIDPSPIETMDRGTLIYRAFVLASCVTIFYASAVWLRRQGSSVPDDIRSKLPQDPPPYTTTQKGSPDEVDS